MLVPGPELDALVMQWNNHAPGYNDWPNTIALVSIREVTSLYEIWSWGVQVGQLNIMRSINTRNITLASEELATALPGVSTIHRVAVTRPLMVGSATIEPSKNLCVLTGWHPGMPHLTVIELGCPHTNSEHSTQGNLVDRHRCTDCGFEYEVDHGD